MINLLDEVYTSSCRLARGAEMWRAGVKTPYSALRRQAGRVVYLDLHCRVLVRRATQMHQLRVGGTTWSLAMCACQVTSVHSL